MLPAILSLSGPTLTADERGLIRDARPAGLILFGRNIEDPAQLRALTDAIRDAAGRDDILIMTDQEGGLVARLRGPHWPDFPAASAFGALYDRAPISALEAARVSARAMGAVLADMGINLAAAPVLDLAFDGAHPVIGSRAFSGDPPAVASLGRAVLDGLAEAGVAGIVKHMPGHGRATADSHEELPRVDASAEHLAADFFPFERLAPRAGFGMTAHIVYSAWDGERPATLSPTVIGDVIRGRIGFGGILMTDDIAMGALGGDIVRQGQAALAAGCDLVLHNMHGRVETEGMLAVLPEAPDDLAARIVEALPDRPVVMPDMRADLAKRDALLAL